MTRVASPRLSLVFASVGPAHSHLFVILSGLALVVFAAGLMLPSERAPQGSAKRRDMAPVGTINGAESLAASA